MSRFVLAWTLLIFTMAVAVVRSSYNETTRFDAGEGHPIPQSRRKMCVRRGRKCDTIRKCCSGICTGRKCRAYLSAYGNSTQLGLYSDNCGQVLDDCRSICAPYTAVITCDPKPPCCFCWASCSEIPTPLWWCNSADDVCRNYCLSLDSHGAKRCFRPSGGDICSCYC